MVFLKSFLTYDIDSACRDDDNNGYKQSIDNDNINNNLFFEFMSNFKRGSIYLSRVWNKIINMNMAKD